MSADDRGRPGEQEQGSLWAAAGEYTGYGLTWALAVLLFLFAGWWLDGKLGTTPVLMILGAFVGGAAGFYSLYHHVVVGPRRRGEGPFGGHDEGAG